MKYISRVLSIAAILMFVLNVATLFQNLWLVLIGLIVWPAQLIVTAYRKEGLFALK